MRDGRWVKFLIEKLFLIVAYQASAGHFLRGLTAFPWLASWTLARSPSRSQASL